MPSPLLSKAFACLLLLLAVSSVLAAVETIDLSGAWELSLADPEALPAWQAMKLPGTLDDAGIGTPLALRPALNLQVLAHLQRRHSYVGQAWYRRSVEIPESWSGREITLELERVMWESEVFVDGQRMGTEDSLTTPHRYDLSGALLPGRHELLIRIDNSEVHPDVSVHAKSYPSADDAPLAHAYTNHTQVIWNGVLGGVRLLSEAGARLSGISVQPRLTPGRRLRLTGLQRSLGDQRWSLELRGPGGERVDGLEVTLPRGAWELEWTLPWGTRIQPWDEFSPSLYQVVFCRQGAAEPETTVRFGFRDLSADGAELCLNGHRIFLRGDLECAIFPRTGHPAMDQASWQKLLGSFREWGLNHVRFHSWCPPAAAFEVADELGLYLQVELPHWSLEVGRNPASWRWVQSEADRILAEYGNHPSFMFLSLGNELQGDLGLLNAELRRLRVKDSRRLYTCTTFTFENGHGKAPEPADQYLITQYTADGWIRGQGVFNERTPSFDADYRDAAARIQVPLIAHEVGQYSVYPDLREISSYTGNLVPLNLIAIREDLMVKGLLPLSDQFTAASGRFAALLYKEEIERALRTPQLDGFQLLSLQDFPGQGTALVGLANVFWKPKGVMSSREFREFCGPVVPLARFGKAVYERGETFVATVEMANFWRPMLGVSVAWSVSDDQGHPVASGKLEPVDLGIGNNQRCGQISVPIPAEGKAGHWTLELAIPGTEYRNHWSLWVYPRAVQAVPASVKVVSTWAEARVALSAGRRVFFNPPIDQIRGIPGRFVPVFWSPVHFPDQPGTMGILCDPGHRALAGFPTQAHSDWQWWDLTLRSKSVVIDGLQVQPLVRVIDNFCRNHSLANVFETRVGGGRLLFCAIDLQTDLGHRPTARALKESLLAYMASNDFQPATTVSVTEISSLIESPTQGDQGGGGGGLSGLKPAGGNGAAEQK